MEKILLAYHIHDETRRNALQEAMKQAAVVVRFVNKNEYELTLAQLLDLRSEPQDAAAPKGMPIEDEMIVFAFIASEELSQILASLREHSLRIPRKAMLTKSNQAWNGYQLFDELSQEVAYVAQMRATKK